MKTYRLQLEAELRAPEVDGKPELTVSLQEARESLLSTRPGGGYAVCANGRPTARTADLVITRVTVVDEFKPSKDIHELEWQRTNGNEWIFGRKIRGIVRVIIAEVYFDEGLGDRDCGWVWLAYDHKADLAEGERGKRGKEANLQWAVDAAEQAVLNME